MKNTKVEFLKYSSKINFHKHQNKTRFHKYEIKIKFNNCETAQSLNSQGSKTNPREVANNIIKYLPSSAIIDKVSVCINCLVII